MEAVAAPVNKGERKRKAHSPEEEKEEKEAKVNVEVGFVVILLCVFSLFFALKFI